MAVVPPVALFVVLVWATEIKKTLRASSFLRRVVEPRINAMFPTSQGVTTWETEGYAFGRIVPYYVSIAGFLIGLALVSYTVGVVKRASAATTYVTVDGGMSDNPRPAMYNARYTALLANRADEAPAGFYAVAGKHCESGDVLIERVELPEPRRGDLLAVPVTGAYTLAMSSTYNAVPRPAAVLVAGGEARLIRRRETVEDLLALEA